MNRILLALPLLLLFGCTLFGPQPLGQFGSTHEHADFKVYLNGKAYDFSQPKYQSPSGNDPTQENCGLDHSKLAHLHDGDGDVAHKHATGVTWAYFFSTLNMSMADSCLTLDTGEKYCNSGEKRWRFFINRKEVSNLPEAEMHNLDQALFTYGATDAQIAAQLDSVTSKAVEHDTEGYCGPSNQTNSSSP